MSSRVFFRFVASVSKAGIKPPIQLFGLDGTYATALFTAASKISSIESASKSLESLNINLSKNANLATILKNPTLSSQDRSLVVQTLVKASPSLDKCVENLIKVLGENNRLNLLSKIYSQFTKLTDAYNGLVQASVTTAEPMDGKLFKRVEKALSVSSLVGAGKTLRLQNIVKPEIKGGLIIEIDEKTMDLSISSKITKLNKVLKDSI